MRGGDTITDRKLESVLNNLNDLPGVQARGILRPGSRPATTALEIEAMERHVWNNYVFADNGGSRNSGRYRYGLHTELNNLGHNGDKIGVTGYISNKQQKEITVTLEDISRVYGDLTAQNYTADIESLLVNGDTVDSTEATFTATDDGAIAAGTLSNPTKTSDVGSYTWSGMVSGNETFEKNYSVTVEAGKSDVTQKEITVTLGDLTRVYGDLTAQNYTAAIESLLVNGDTVDSTGATFTATDDGAIAEGTLAAPTKTSDVGGYSWTGTVSGNETFSKNYNVTVEAGKSDVTKAGLTIMVNDINIVIGSTPVYSGAISGLANGDDEAAIGFGGYALDSSVNPAVEGVYADSIGVLLDGTLYLTGGDILQNYYITIDPGTLAVSASGPHNPDWWDAEDKYPWYQWDKQRHMRERKAEVHFVGGGMAVQ